MKLPSHACAEASPFGTLLGLAPGGVPSYSSDYDTADESVYPDRRSFRSYHDGIFMGYKWQCVEFARRWMYVNCGYIFSDVSMAYEIFDLRSVRCVGTNECLPLHAFRNGAKSHPVPGSLLIWEAGGEFETTGHVAVVTDVLPGSIRLAEQNLNHKIWPDGRHWSRELRTKITEDGDFWIECSFSDASIVGWVTQTADARHAEPTDAFDRRLLNVSARTAPDRPEARKSWLNVANDDEAAYVDMMGGHKLASADADQLRYFALSTTAREELKDATNELHGMFMHATDYVLEHPQLLARFQLPAAILPRIRRSWDNRLNQLITSRFDFSLSERGLKVYEYNCDSASCYMECGKIQGKWARHFVPDEGEDAGKELFADLVKTWEKSDARALVHVLRDDDPEEAYHALFMKEAIEAAGFSCTIIVGLSSLRWDEAGEIADAEGNPVDCVWKTWAWETALDQIRAECEADDAHAGDFVAQHAPGEAPRLVDVLLRDGVRVYEPLWTLIPSNKAILPVLWSLFPNHPLLLHTAFDLNADLEASGYVSKPIVGRCGANVQLIDQTNTVIASTDGRFATRDQIYQELFPLPYAAERFVQTSTFTAGGVYAGSCLRVDPTMIVSKDSDCLPLIFVGDKDLRAP